MSTASSLSYSETLDKADQLVRYEKVAAGRYRVTRRSDGAVLGEVERDGFVVGGRMHYDWQVIIDGRTVARGDTRRSGAGRLYHRAAKEGR